MSQGNIINLERRLMYMKRILLFGALFAISFLIGGEIIKPLDLPYEH